MCLEVPALIHYKWIHEHKSLTVTKARQVGNQYTLWHTFVSLGKAAIEYLILARLPSLLTAYTSLNTR